MLKSLFVYVSVYCACMCMNVVVCVRVCVRIRISARWFKAIAVQGNQVMCVHEPGGCTTACALVLSCAIVQALARVGGYKV
jgi:hypothetical protein